MCTCSKAGLGSRTLVRCGSGARSSAALHLPLYSGHLQNAIASATQPRQPEASELALKYPVYRQTSHQACKKMSFTALDGPDVILWHPSIPPRAGAKVSVPSTPAPSWRLRGNALSRSSRQERGRPSHHAVCSDSKELANRADQGGRPLRATFYETRLRQSVAVDVLGRTLRNCSRRVRTALMVILKASVVLSMRRNEG